MNNMIKWMLPFCFSLMLLSIVFGLSLVSDPLSTEGGLLIADAKDAKIENIRFVCIDAQNSPCNMSYKLE